MKHGNEEFGPSEHIYITNLIVGNDIVLVKVDFGRIFNQFLHEVIIKHIYRYMITIYMRNLKRPLDEFKDDCILLRKYVSSKFHSIWKTFCKISMTY